jgi:hypothetical protein
VACDYRVPSSGFLSNNNNKVAAVGLRGASATIMTAVRQKERGFKSVMTGITCAFDRWIFGVDEPHHLVFAALCLFLPSFVSFYQPSSLFFLSCSASSSLQHRPVGINQRAIILHLSETCLLSFPFPWQSPDDHHHLSWHIICTFVPIETP